jgi:hypothetical protein
MFMLAAVGGGFPSLGATTGAYRIAATFSNRGGAVQIAY